ncbi:MAG TPA: phage holin family protein [Actinomycetota bacterium]|nr:phage holin family protein [Actinomycetota bacterium]
MAEVSTRSTGELIRDVADDLRMLVRKEMELARVELVDSLSSKLKGAGLIAAGVLAAFPGLLFLAVALAVWLPVGTALGFLIVGLIMLALTALGVVLGARALKEKSGGVGTSVESIKEDVRWARGHLKR